MTQLRINAKMPVWSDSLSDSLSNIENYRLVSLSLLELFSLDT